MVVAGMGVEADSIAETIDNGEDQGTGDHQDETGTETETVAAPDHEREGEGGIRQTEGVAADVNLHPSHIHPYPRTSHLHKREQEIDPHLQAQGVDLLSSGSLLSLQGREGLKLYLVRQ